MDSGKLLRPPERSSPPLVPAGEIDLIVSRRRAFLQLEGYSDAESDEQQGDTAPPVHTRSKLWQSDDAYEMRRITTLTGKGGNLIGYRPMIQQGRGQTGKRVHASFRVAELGSAEEALRQAKQWRDDTESKLGIRLGERSSKFLKKPVSGISLIVATKPGGRCYWGSDQVPGKATIRIYIGQKSYIEAYQEAFTRMAYRDGIPIPGDLPQPPPPRVDQYKRMVKAGFTDIPQPVKKRKPKTKVSA